MVPGSRHTSTRFTATRLPNRLVTPVTARIVIGFPNWGFGARRAPMRATAPTKPGRCSLSLSQLQRCRFPVADGDELAVLDLDQGSLLDRITGMLAVEHVDHR